MKVLDSLSIFGMSTFLGVECPGSGRRESSFNLPDIPENERIKVFTPKVRKHATKRCRNKLHDRRRK